MKKRDIITEIKGKKFFYGGWNDNGWHLIYTDDESFHVPQECDFIKECHRIYHNYYE